MGSTRKVMSIYQKTMRMMMTTIQRRRSMRTATLSQGPRARKTPTAKRATMTKTVKVRVAMMMTMMTKRKVATMLNLERGKQRIRTTDTVSPPNDRSE